LLLVLALLVPEGIGMVLAAAGLAGLVVFRLAAMRRAGISRGLLAKELPTPDAADHDEDGAPGGSGEAE
jgi:hypothetical protein